MKTIRAVVYSKRYFTFGLLWFYALTMWWVVALLASEAVLYSRGR
jgi:hypothetical protein